MEWNNARRLEETRKALIDDMRSDVHPNLVLADTMLMLSVIFEDQANNLERLVTTFDDIKQILSEMLRRG